MATRGLHGPGTDEASLILDKGDIAVLHTCLNEALDPLERTQVTDTQWVYKDALERIRAALHECVASTKARTHLRVVRPNWEDRTTVEVLTTKEDMESALARVDAIHEKGGIDEEDRDAVWQGMAAFCLYQLETRRGPFYEAAKRLLRP